jgi:hypothetical protein
MHICIHGFKTYVFTEIQHNDKEGSTEQDRCTYGQLKNGFLPISAHKTNNNNNYYYY